ALLIEADGDGAKDICLDIPVIIITIKAHTIAPLFKVLASGGILKNPKKLANLNNIAATAIKPNNTPAKPANKATIVKKTIEAMIATIKSRYLAFIYYLLSSL
ncbi:hypothetical protein CO177_00945, partial [Candidatus Wolfebacteria bacterium CG_4_9_14_3_um_filter_37_9]